MEIQAGKTYRSRSGEVFGPIDFSSNYSGHEAWTKLIWLCPRTGQTWGETGLYLPITEVPDDLDLIEAAE